MLVDSNKDEHFITTALCEDHEDLYQFLNGLSRHDLRNFAPHPFDRQSIMNILENANIYWCYIARNKLSNDIIAYSIIRRAYPKHEYDRLTESGFDPDPDCDCLFAPYVTPTQRGNGLGKKVFSHIAHQLKFNAYKRVILWGGVAVANKSALLFYDSLGFERINCFEYNGENYDMVLYL